MYNDWFSIGPLTIHGYGVMTAIALIAALLTTAYRAKKRGLSEDICYGLLFVGAIFGYMGSKLLYVIVEFDDFLKDPKMVLSSGGFVVFGGLTTGILSCCLYCHIKKANFMDYFDLAAPSIALAQCIGRIGCFFAGCCYGRETDKWFGITFTHSDFAPNGVSLIPTQLIMSGLDLVHAIILYLLSRKVKKKGVISGLYIIIYSVGRFFVEYLRADGRGNVGKLSTSQFYGLFSLAFGLIFLFYRLKKDEPVKPVIESGADTDEEV